uniref:hypothetical protein n=1 Tax=Pantanalinema rosaneae TaxID=1620701 RepID=UPI003D6E96CA
MGLTLDSVHEVGTLRVDHEIKRNAGNDRVIAGRRVGGRSVHIWPTGLSTSSGNLLSPFKQRHQEGVNDGQCLGFAAALLTSKLEVAIDRIELDGSFSQDLRMAAITGNEQSIVIVTSAKSSARPDVGLLLCLPPPLSSTVSVAL